MEKELTEALSKKFRTGPPAVGAETETLGASRLRVDLGRAPADAREILAAVDSGLRMIQWNCPGPRPRLPERLLWQTSHRGVWNHVRVPDLARDLVRNARDKETLKFILDNPNIVHSFDMGRAGKLPRGMGAYDRVAPLPGRPVWSLLPDEDSLLYYLHHMSKDALVRLRWHETEKRLFFLGDHIAYHFRSPEDLPEGFMDEICRMVDAGGSVGITHVRANLEKAHLIGYAMEFGVIVGDSSLKHPREAFIRRLKDTVGLDFSGFVERGYTSVRPEYRAFGVGKKLLEGLTQRAGEYKVFSIIGEDNPATQKIALRNNTRKILVYFSEKTNKEMGIWMPENMIPEAEAQWGRKV